MQRNWPSRALLVSRHTLSYRTSATLLKNKMAGKKYASLVDFFIYQSSWPVSLFFHRFSIPCRRTRCHLLPWRIRHISGLNGDDVCVVVADWWHVLCTTIHHLNIASLYQFNKGGASVFLTVLKIIPSGFLNTLVYRNTLIPPKPTLYCSLIYQRMLN